jgi:hypothetical protein
MVGRFARRASLLPVAGLLVFPACTQNPAPPSSTSPVTAPIATTSQVPGDGATTTHTPATDEQLAIKAVERFYDEFNKAVVSLSTKEFRTTYKPGCEICDQAASKVDSTAAAGLRFEGGRISVGDIRVVSRAPSIQMYTLQARVFSTPVAVKDSTGRTVESDQGASATKFFRVFKADRGWIVSGLGDL